MIDKKIIDCFTFFNELEMLEFRLRELNHLVDRFVLVESTHSFAGNSKDLYFKDNKNRYVQYLDKIIHIIVDDMPETDDAWDREHHQRRCIKRGIDQIDLEDHDIIVISDLDEVPNPFTLEGIKVKGISDVYSLEQDMYYYNLHCRAGKKWYKPKIMNYGSFKKNNQDPETIRMSARPIMKRGGWHFSYFGSIEYIKNKIRNFAHQEYNNRMYLNDEKIKKQIANYDDLFFRENKSCHDFRKVELRDNDCLPKNYEFLMKMRIYDYEKQHCMD